MNSTNILLAATLAGGLLSASFASAAVVVDTAALTGSDAYSAPALVKVVSPTGIARRYEGETIRLSLTIDEAGRPHAINLLSTREPHLVRHLLPVVAQWRFAPAKKNGQAMTTDIVLPIQLVDGSAS